MASASVDRVHQPGRYRIRRCASCQQLAGVRVQQQNLGVGIAVRHHAVELAWLKVRQHRIQQQDCVVRPVLAEQSQRSRAAACLDHIPARKPQLVLQLLAKAAVWTYHKYVDGRSFFGALDRNRGNAHGIHRIIPTLKLSTCHLSSLLHNFYIPDKDRRNR